MSTTKQPEQVAANPVTPSTPEAVAHVANRVSDAALDAAWEDATAMTRPPESPYASDLAADSPSWEDQTVLSPAAAPMPVAHATPAPRTPAPVVASRPVRPLAATMEGPMALSSGRLTPQPNAATAVAEAPAPAPVTLQRPGEGPIDPYLNSLIAERYRILRKLGEGGMGVVYLAEHIIIEKKVALKILSEDFARKADLVQRFMQEAKAASKIGHENIVDITDFGETPSGSVFIAMEYLEGKDLATHIRESGAMPFERCRNVVTQICRALGAAHAKGIIHRDMKPENVYLVEREGRKDFVKILDFGIAKVSSLDEGGARLTRTGMIFGTPEYMSPEQARGDRPDHRVDIYAVGCILYEMLTGDVPFHADTFMGVLTKHMFETPEPPSKRAPERNIPADAEAVALKALSKDRDQRYQTMKDFSVAVAACGGMDADEGWGNEPSGVFELTPPSRRTAEAVPVAGGPATGMPSTARKTPAPQLEIVKPRSRAAVWVGIVGMLAIAGGAAAVVLSRPPLPLPSVPVAPAPQPVREQGKPSTTEAAILPKPVAPVDVAPAQVTLSVTSKPIGAEVFRGKELLGTTPASIQLPTDGRPMVLLLKKKDYKDREIEVTPDKDRSYDFDLGAVAHHSSSNHGGTRSSDPAKSAPLPGPPKPGAGKLRDLKDPFGDDKGR